MWLLLLLTGNSKPKTSGCFSSSEKYCAKTSLQEDLIYCLQDCSENLWTFLYTLKSVWALKGGQGREFGNDVPNLVTCIQISFMLPFLVSEMGRFYLNLVCWPFILLYLHTEMPKIQTKTKENQKPPTKTKQSPPNPGRGKQEQRQVTNSFSIKFLQRPIPVLVISNNASIQGPGNLSC